MAVVSIFITGPYCHSLTPDPAGLVIWGLHNTPTKMKMTFKIYLLNVSSLPPSFQQNTLSSSARFMVHRRFKTHARTAHQGRDEIERPGTARKTENFLHLRKSIRLKKKYRHAFCAIFTSGRRQQSYSLDGVRIEGR